MRIAFLLSAALTLCPVPAFGQSNLTPNTLKLDDPANKPAATIEDVAWIAGYWQGDFLGGTAEEAWMPPSGGAMAGAFRHVTKEGVGLYELMTIAEEGGSLVLKLKHFNPDLSGWEEKDEFVSFPLVKIKKGRAYFEGLSLESVDANTMQGHLAIHSEGEVQETSFTYRRTRLESNSR